MGRSRGGLTTKVHALVDANGLPLELVLTPGQAGDCPVAAHLLGHLRENTIVLADKAYDADWLRRQIEAAGAAPNIPPMGHRRWKPCFSPVLYRARNRIERFFNRIKHFRRLATRYEKHAANWRPSVIGGELFKGLMTGGAWLARFMLLSVIDAVIVT